MQWANQTFRSSSSTCIGLGYVRVVVACLAYLVRRSPPPELVLAQFFGPATNIPFANETYRYLHALPRHFDLAEFLEGACIAHDAVIGAVYGDRDAIDLDTVVAPRQTKALKAQFDHLRREIPRKNMERAAEQAFLAHVPIRPLLDGDELHMQAYLSVMFPLTSDTTDVDGRPFSSMVFSGYDSRTAVEDHDYRLEFLTMPMLLTDLYAEQIFDSTETDQTFRGMRPVTNKSRSRPPEEN